jgi:hypothetical protein
MAQLGGRSIRTLITALEVLSDDEKNVLMVNRNEDGSVQIKTRLRYASSWGSEGPTFAVKAEDARTLALLLGSQDASYHRTKLDDISSSDFSAEKPQEVLDAEAGETPGDCTELDIERAKAANLTEQRAIVELELRRDHALDKHVGWEVEGCPSCDRSIRPGDGSLQDRVQTGESHADDGPDPDVNTDDIPY